LSFGLNCICLVIDRLHVGYPGCYGNSWIETPTFNRLAADGFLFDRALIESPELAAQYASYATGTHALARSSRGAVQSPHSGTQPTLAARLAAGGVHTTLISDDPAVSEFPSCDAFDEIVRVEQHYADAPANDVAQTNLGRYFAVVTQWLQSAPEPFCLWLHCGALASSWDAPLDLRQKYADEDEPPPLSETAVPCRQLAADYDPDELLSIVRAYAGQVSLLDLCLGATIDELDRLPVAKRTLLSVLSARGFPLGEHRRIGPIDDDALYAELVHAAWILRFPDGGGAAARTGALVQACDLAPTLLDWFKLPPSPADCDGQSLLPLVRGEVESIRDRAIIVGAGGGRAIHTPAWYLLDPRKPAGADAAKSAAPVELYAKPDDRWELNDVADRCPSVVELLEQALAGGLPSGQTTPAPPLADILLSGLD